jgi:hypothetical protein
MLRFLQKGFFDGTFQNFGFIVERVCTLPVPDEGSNQIAFAVGDRETLLLYLRMMSLVKVMFEAIKVQFNGPGLLFSNRSSGITFDTAGTPAIFQITDKMFLDYIQTNYGPVYFNHPIR